MYKNRKRAELLESWKAIEQTLPDRGAIDFQLAWGAAREEFYKKVGYIPCADAEIRRLRSLRDHFKGERIFIVGNGPSLNKTPLHLLKNDFTFVTNRAYLLFDRIGWRPSFYTALDWRVVPDIAHEINLLNGMICFFEERFRGILREGEDVFWYTHTPAPSRGEKTFAYDIGLGVRGAGSVVGTAIQIAFFLGFREIFLIGCDLGYRVNSSVRQEGDDVFGTGTKLLLTSTEDDDPNHFDKRYFGKGRRWHDPNVKRMIAGHEQCKAGVESAGGRIYNATVGGELDVYSRVDFASLFPRTSYLSPRRALNALLPRLDAIWPDARSEQALVGPFLRCERKHLDETDIVFDLLRDRSGVSCAMLDVGAHHGTSCINFLNAQWRVYAFEPDHANRQALIRRTGASKYASLINIDHRAVGEHNQIGVPFFTSAQSSGISSLTAFHSTHSRSQSVDVVTLAEFLRDKPESSVEFLKIDTEGHELFVLRGFPWERFRPEVIECEFEDSKTVPLGYTFRDLADYLLAKDYTVYVSEWHPIIRYGVRHDWCRITRYPCELVNGKNWGNLLAFRDGINEGKLISAVKGEMIADTVRLAQRSDGGTNVAIGQAARKQKGSYSMHSGDSDVVKQVGPIVFDRILPGNYFKQISATVWRYYPSKNDGPKLWLAAFDLTTQTHAMELVAEVVLKADRFVDLRVSLGRIGQTPYEGVHQVVHLEPRTEQTVRLRKQFSKAQRAVKVQLEILQLEGTDTSDLTIGRIYVIETLKSIAERVGDRQIDLKVANRLFRARNYQTAMGIYLLLGARCPLHIYGTNALMCARKMRMESVSTVEQLREYCE